MPDNNSNKLSPQEATSKIREIVRFGETILTSHIRMRMKQRGYNAEDLDLIFSEGEVIKIPEWSSEYDEWKYTVEGNDIEGEKASVIVAIVNHRAIKCITIKPK